MEVVINKCYGGFSLSPKAIKRIAELQGRDCYFFKTNFTNGQDRYEPVSIEEVGNSLFFSAFDIPNPNEVCNQNNWHQMSDEEKKISNENYQKHSLPSGRELERTDPLLIQVIKELGAGHRTGASGGCAELKIVEIPDGVEYEIDEYDGLESIHEKHRSWG